ncbi:glycoside hydrolase family 47 protein [Neolentinus lepideus HHB14362 ss-1]|uniref:alpha-1,2-Mannosidase n=1 Tax=Neolentinus lepideus HHB14362 ss-1 TaxID=1314782 RepID=A0A165SVJ5_9AGAM|nr:glycoside hydrolase family 47 protein [Neolentinus lepideus HHB14362 ss-1]
MVSKRLLAAGALALSSCSLVRGGLVQKPGLEVPAYYAGNLTVVRTMFTDSWNAYKKYAWGHDDLDPISEGYNDGRNGWGASIADALGTMVIMGLEDDFLQAVNYTYYIDFSKSQTPDTVSVFETSIRYVAGFLSAYELSGFEHPILVEKAKEVADKLMYAWVGNNSIPYGYLNFTTNQPTITTTNIAEAGTLTLEYTTLTKYTGNQTYANNAVKSVEYIASLPDPLPGLAPQGIDPTSGQFTDAYLTWGGGSDSYFEYLIKYPRLTNTNNPIFVETWQAAVDSSIKYLVRNSTVGNWTYVADRDDNGNIVHIGSHLECFHAGNWMLGGKLLNNQTYVDYGLALVDACINTYTSTATGIGPEVFAYFSSDGNYTGVTPSTSDYAFYQEHGFFIYDGASDYILRPEVLESNFYAWRITGDTKYLDNAAAAAASFNKYLYIKSSGGYAGTNDVNNVTASLVDDTESFWFAEVLKYLYLTFDDPNHISLDNWVFNTECHPFLAPPPGIYATPTFNTNTQGFKAVGGPLPQISPNSYLPKSINSILQGVGLN